MGARAIVRYGQWVLAGNVADPKGQDKAIAKLYVDPIDLKWGYKLYTGESEFGLTRREVLGRIKTVIGSENYIYEAPRVEGFDPKMPMKEVSNPSGERISARIYKREMKKRTKGAWNG